MRNIPFVSFLAVLLFHLLSLLPASAIVLTGDVDPGGSVGDGGEDQYDDFGILLINSTAYVGVVTDAEPTFNVAAQLIDGINVTGQVMGLQPLGDFGGNTDYRIIRWWYSLTNTTAATQSPIVNFGGNLGSDSATTYSFLTASPGARTISDDEPLGNDPAIATLFSSASAPVQFGLGIGEDGLAASARVTIPPFATVSLVFFAASRNVGGFGAAGIGTPADASFDLNSVLLDGVSNLQPAFLSGGLTEPIFALNHVETDGSITLSRLRARLTRKNVLVVRGSATSPFGISRVDVKIGRLTGRATGTNSFSLRTRTRGNVRVFATDIYGQQSDEVRVRLRK